jgi:hypothetical protein
MLCQCMHVSPLLVVAQDITVFFVAMLGGSHSKSSQHLGGSSQPGPALNILNIVTMQPLPGAQGGS